MKKCLYSLTAAAFSGAALGKFVAAAAVVTTLAAVDATPAQAMCRAYGPPSGAWVNVDPGTREITRIRINYSCNDTLAIPADATPEEIAELRSRLGQHWSVQMWGKCHPRDCAWGGASAEPMPVGGIQNIVARYDQGFAKRRAVMRMKGSRMQLILTSTYNDGRPTRKTSSWFVRAR